MFIECDSYFCMLCVLCGVFRGNVLKGGVGSDDVHIHSCKSCFGNDLSCPPDESIFAIPHWISLFSDEFEGFLCIATSPYDVQCLSMRHYSRFQCAFARIHCQKFYSWRWSLLLVQRWWEWRRVAKTEINTALFPACRDLFATRQVRSRWRLSLWRLRADENVSALLATVWQILKLDGVHWYRWVLRNWSEW